MSRAVTADNADESFQSLVLRCRGRTGLTQRELAERLGVHVRSVQAWEAGVSYPSSESLKALIVGYLQAAGFDAGREAVQAESLWTAALRESTRVRAGFDRQWFAQQLLDFPRAHLSAPIKSRNPTQSRAQDWGDAPDVLGFLGRREELARLDQWVLADRARLVVVLGMGGIGKTILAARLANDLTLAFDRVFWRSVRNAPSLSDWLGEAIGFLSEHDVLAPESEAERIGALLQLLRSGRHLLILDNFEVLLQPGERAAYRDGYAGYGALVDMVGRTQHQSCLVLTSREAPPELEQLGGARAAVHELELGGLGVDDGQTLLGDKWLQGSADDWNSLVVRYGGNGLALKVVGQTIHQIFGGDIAAFLDQSPSTPVFGGIKRVLDAQVARLSNAEEDVMRWLAVAREPTTFAGLADALGARTGRGPLLEALEGLRRRSLVERIEPGPAFTLQSVVLEYATDRLVERVLDEIGSGAPEVLARQPLVIAQAKDFVRQSQERLIVQPVLERLRTTESGRKGVEERLTRMLNDLRGHPLETQGYAPGNLLNILRVLRGDLRGLDLSRLELRQTVLQNVEAQDTSLADAHISETTLSSAFNYPTSVALSADGGTLAVGTSTGEICLWRVSDRQLITTLRGHTSLIIGLALNADGTLVVSGSHDATVRLWNVKDKPGFEILSGQSGAALAVAISDDGRLIASGNFDGSVRIWNAVGDRSPITIQAHASRVRWISFGGDGLLASCGTDGTVAVWDARSGRQIAWLDPSDARLLGVGLSADGELLATGGMDGNIRLWASTTGRLVNVLEGHGGRIWNLALSRDGQVLASGSEDGAVRLWDTRAGRALAMLQGHFSTVYGVALSGDGQLVASGSFDGLVRLSDGRSGRVLTTLQGHASGVWGVALSLDGRTLASGGEDGVVRIWDPATGHETATLQTGTHGVWGVALSADGGLLVSGSYDGSLRLWETRSRRLLSTIDGHTTAYCGVSLSQDGQLVASGSVDGLARVWDCGTGKLVASLSGHGGMVYDVAFSQDGSRLVTGSFDGVVRIWEMPGGRLIASLTGYQHGVCGVALHNDGRRVFSGGYDGTVRVWDWTSGEILGVLEGHTGTVWHVAVSDDGQILASSSADGTVRVWNASNGDFRKKQVLSGHEGVAWGVALSRDGQLLASTGVDSTIRLWDTSSGRQLRVMRADRRYERLDITGLTGITEAQREALLAQGALDRGP